MAARKPFTQRRTAHELLERAIAGSREDAAVLLDVLLESGQTEIAEELALGLAGRATSDEILGGQFYLRGDPLPEHLVVANLSHVLAEVRSALFPRRQTPCLPNRDAVRDLLATAKHVHAWGSEYDVTLATRQLMSAMRRACTRGLIADAMEVADDLLGGEGVDVLSVPVRRGRERWGHIVILPNLETPTLFYDADSGRFRVSSYVDLVRTFERRYGRPEEGT